jgi:hypothetical protein
VVNFISLPTFALSDRTAFDFSVATTTYKSRFPYYSAAAISPATLRSLDRYSKVILSVPQISASFSQSQAPQVCCHTAYALSRLTNAQLIASLHLQFSKYEISKSRRQIITPAAKSKSVTTRFADLSHSPICTRRSQFHISHLKTLRLQESRSISSQVMLQISQAHISSLKLSHVDIPRSLSCLQASVSQITLTYLKESLAFTQCQTYTQKQVQVSTHCQTCFTDPHIPISGGTGIYIYYLSITIQKCRRAYAKELHMQLPNACLEISAYPHIMACILRTFSLRSLSLSLSLSVSLSLSRCIHFTLYRWHKLKHFMQMKYLCLHIQRAITYSAISLGTHCANYGDLTHTFTNNSQNSQVSHQSLQSRSGHSAVNVS